MVYKPIRVKCPHVSAILPFIPRRMVARRRSNYLVLISVFFCFYIVSRPVHYSSHPNAVSAKDLLFGCPRLLSYHGNKAFKRIGVVSSPRLEFDKAVLKIISQAEALYYISPTGMMTPSMKRDLYLWSANESRSFDVALGSSKCSTKDIEEVIEKSDLQTFYIFYDHKDFPRYKDTDSILDHLQCFINVLDAIKEREVKKAVAKKKSAFIPVHVILRLDLISRYHTLMFEKLSAELNHHFDNITSFTLGKGHCKAKFQFRNDYEAYFFSINTIAKVFRETFGLDVTISPVY